jgi:hypothetical protein
MGCRSFVPTFAWPAFVAIGAASILCGACVSAASSPQSLAAPSPSPSIAAPTEAPPSPTPSPSPTPASSATQEAVGAVTFGGLPMGSFPVHLHSVCDGRQNFHITVLGTLVVNSSGQGTISVPDGYFGRGLCVIVYGNTALSTVIATRTI